MLAMLASSSASALLMSSCGTIIYPDRANQEKRGNIDPVIAILDGVGCLLFLIPGLIAFAVDFHTGAIYFPAGKTSHDKEPTIFDQTSMYEHHNGKLTQQDIEEVVSTRIGTKIDLSQGDVLCVEAGGVDQANKIYAQITQNKV